MEESQEEKDMGEMDMEEKDMEERHMEERKGTAKAKEEARTAAGEADNPFVFCEEAAQ